MGHAVPYCLRYFGGTCPGPGWLVRLEPATQFSTTWTLTWDLFTGPGIGCFVVAFASALLRAVVRDRHCARGYLAVHSIVLS